MSFDLVCGVRAFSDLIFVGLEAIPAPGEERHAEGLERSPGGGAIVAIGAARLGLDVALAAPLGTDDAGEFVTDRLSVEGVRCIGEPVERTPTTVVMPMNGDRAMATFDPHRNASPTDLAKADARAAVVGIDQLADAPDGMWLYATVGDAEARDFAQQRNGALSRARALLVNEREALLMSGEQDVERAARALAEVAECVVVTLGGAGAIAVSAGELHKAEGKPQEVTNTTGAGDLFAAAFVWADLAGAALPDRLRWGVLYASLSVTQTTALEGAADRAALVAAGGDQGLAPPESQLSTPLTETE